MTLSLVSLCFLLQKALLGNLLLVQNQVWAQLLQNKENQAIFHVSGGPDVYVKLYFLCVFVCSMKVRFSSSFNSV